MKKKLKIKIGRNKNKIFPKHRTQFNAQKNGMNTKKWNGKSRHFTKEKNTEMNYRLNTRNQTTKIKESCANISRSKTPHTKQSK